MRLIRFPPASPSTDTNNTRYRSIQQPWASLLSLLDTALNVLISGQTRELDVELSRQLTLRYLPRYFRLRKNSVISILYIFKRLPWRLLMEVLLF
jgi:hypothetical protein